MDKRELLDRAERAERAGQSAGTAARRKDYHRPRVIHEADLEVRAGSPLQSPEDPRAGKPWDADYNRPLDH